MREAALSERYDIAVIGSGFAGSLLAMVAQRIGRRVILLERGKHPRTVIGESSTPLSNILLEELAAKYDLPNIRPLSKWGSWQTSHPELACGLKRGFSFFHHVPHRAGVIARENQLLVAASPHDVIADTHWYRADFDEFLINEAQRMDIDYLDEVDLSELMEADHGITLNGTQKGRDVEIEARFVVDATGPRGFLHNILKLGERALPDFPATQALYNHFYGVNRLNETSAIALDSEQLPYPIDDAAVHHIFDGGWVWVLRFNNGITSAGIAATNAVAEKLQFSDGRKAWERLLHQFPILKEQFAASEVVQPFRHIPRLAFRSAAICGHNWALLPSAAGFVDPLLSTGFPLTLLGIARLAEILERDWETENFAAQLERYSVQTDAELLATARLIGALYANMGDFNLFAALSMLYFVAATYSETVRRLGKPQFASSFLLHDHPQFGPASAGLLERARSVRCGRESEELIKEVYRVIEPFDVAGLGNRDRRNWYPVDAEDLLSSAYKVGASRDEITQMLDGCGFYPATLRA
jgi:tetracycline 7-halogenase / FADH2 O2-dependent halogenase